jgi:hypothetical protein
LVTMSDGSRSQNPSAAWTLVIDRSGVSAA